MGLSELDHFPKLTVKVEENSRGKHDINHKCLAHRALCNIGYLSTENQHIKLFISLKVKRNGSWRTL